MKLKAYSFYSKLISFCLVLLGFAACDSDDDDNGGGGSIVEYGVPSASYKVSGKVVSSEAGKAPIKNIRVVMIESVEDESKYPYLQGDTVFTNNEGKFEINRHSFPNNKFNIKLQDVDGELNGLFEDQVKEIEFKKSDYEGKDHWYSGLAKKDMGTMEMTPKK